MKRILVGLVTSLLLSANFVSAAERLDVLDSVAHAPAASPEAAPNCTSPCSWNKE